MYVQAGIREESIMGTLLRHGNIIYMDDSPRRYKMRIQGGDSEISTLPSHPKPPPFELRRQKSQKEVSAP